MSYKQEGRIDALKETGTTRSLIFQSMWAQCDSSLVGLLQVFEEDVQSARMERSR